MMEDFMGCIGFILCIFGGIVIHESAHFVMFFYAAAKNMGARKAFGYTRNHLSLAVEFNHCGIRIKIPLFTPSKARNVEASKSEDPLGSAYEYAEMTMAGPMSHIIFSMMVIASFPNTIWLVAFVALWSFLGLHNLEKRLLFHGHGEGDGEAITYLLFASDPEFAAQILGFDPENTRAFWRKKTENDEKLALETKHKNEFPSVKLSRMMTKQEMSYIAKVCYASEWYFVVVPALCLLMYLLK